jgi:hypothetical protein
MNDLMFTNWLEYRDELALHQRRYPKANKAEAQVEEAAPEEAPADEFVCMTIANYADTSNTCWYRVGEVESGDECVIEWGTLMDDSYVECTRTDCFTESKDSGAVKRTDYWGEFRGWLDPK